jgi:hypothetical protein
MRLCAFSIQSGLKPAGIVQRVNPTNPALQNSLAFRRHWSDPGRRATDAAVETPADLTAKMAVLRSL